MKLNKLMSNKIVAASLVAALSLGFMSTSALAADDDTQVKSNDVSITIESGGLHLTTPNIIDFGTKGLTGNNEVYKTKLGGVLKIEDFRGNHAGWNLTAQASQFKNEDDYELPKGSLSISGPSTVTTENAQGVPTVDGYQSPAPDKELKELTVVDDSAVSIIGASAGNGAGTYNVDLGDNSLELTVDPTTAKKGTYTSTVTWTLENTPTFK